MQNLEQISMHTSHKIMNVYTQFATAAMQAGHTEESQLAWTQILNDSLCSGCDLLYVDPIEGNLSIRAKAAAAVAHQ